MRQTTKKIMADHIERELARVSSGADAYRARLEHAKQCLVDPKAVMSLYTVEVFENAVSLERLRYGAEPGFVLERGTRRRVPIAAAEWRARVAELAAAAEDLGPRSAAMLRDGHPGLF